MSKTGVVILLGVIQSFAIICFGLTLLLTSEIVPTNGAVSVTLTNSSDMNMNASVFIYVRDWENASRIRFFNVTVSVLQGENKTYVASIADGSGIEVYVKNMQAKETVSFQVKELEVSPDLPISLNQLTIDLEPRGKATFDLDYDIVFSTLARTRFGTFSVASLRSFNYRSGDLFESMKHERTHEKAYIEVFFTLTFCFLSSLALWIAVPRWKTRIPITTIVVALSSVMLYTFFGSGYEVLANLSSMNSTPIIYPISFLLHGFDDHLSGNLFHFLLVSLLLESWLSVRRTRTTFAVCYVLPLFFTLVSPGIGLSLSIESMTWALWIKIIHGHRDFKTLDKLLCILSGLPSSVFFGWLISYLQGGLSPYGRLLAINHITYGLVAGVIVVVLYLAWRFMDMRRHFLPSIRRLFAHESLKNMAVAKPPQKSTVSDRGIYAVNG